MGGTKRYSQILDPATGTLLAQVPDPEDEWAETLRAQGIEPGRSTPPRPDPVTRSEFEAAQQRIRALGGPRLPTAPLPTAGMTEQPTPSYATGLPGASARRPASHPDGVATAAATGVDPTSGRRWVKGFGAKQFVDGGAPMLPKAGAVTKALGGAPPSDSSFELERRLAEVEGKFPEGLQAKAYTLQGLNPRPSTRGDGSQFITNPINGEPIHLPAGSSPKQYLAAVNAMAQAKARAIADVMRGYSAETASRNRLAEMMGVDPAQLEGLTGQDSAAAMKYLGAEHQRDEAEQNRNDDEAAELDALRTGAAAISPDLAAQLGNVGKPDAFGKMFGIGLELQQQKEKEARAEGKADEIRQQNESMLDAQTELEALDPRQAWQVAGERLMRAGASPAAARAFTAQLWQRANDLDRFDAQNRAEQRRVQMDEQKRVDAEQKAQRDEFTDNVVKPLRDLMTKRPTKVEKSDEGNFTAPDYEKRTEQLIGGLQSVIGYLDGKGLDVGTALQDDTDGMSALARVRSGDSVSNDELEHLLRVLHRVTMGTQNG